MRNKLVHDYMGVRRDIVWETVKESPADFEKKNGRNIGAED